MNEQLFLLELLFYLLIAVGTIIYHIDIFFFTGSLHLKCQGRNFQNPKILDNKTTLVSQKNIHRDGYIIIHGAYKYAN